MKGRAPTDLGLRPNLAPMPLHDAFDRGQAYASSREIVGAVQALEYAKEPVRKTHVETGAVVAHGVGMGQLAVWGEPNLCLRLFAGGMNCSVISAWGNRPQLCRTLEKMRGAVSMLSSLYRSADRSSA